MSRMGSGEYGEFTFLDTIALISFFIGLENLDMNISQKDLQRESNRLDTELNKAMIDIHSHLDSQDSKINIILDYLKEMEARNEKGRKVDKAY